MGETLPGLAARFYGDAALSRLIAGASGITETSAVTVGQRLVVPDITKYTGCRRGHSVGAGCAVLR